MNCVNTKLLYKKTTTFLVCSLYNTYINYFLIQQL